MIDESICVRSDTLMPGLTLKVYLCISFMIFFHMFHTILI